ncbi:MAG: ribosomal-processing cysteine protease Prp [Clostridia bacterium]|nr:ribosomal-processing cysteine protease Prp [Clostridia bacterium]
MITARAFRSGDLLVGFEISGHSGSAESGEDIICAAVSSCAYMTVNTLTDILHLDSSIRIDEGYMKFLIPTTANAAAQTVMKGLYIHLEQLGSQYPDNVKLENTEVKQC